jgi:hypothetical protein
MREQVILETKKWKVVKVQGRNCRPYYDLYRRYFRILDIHQRWSHELKVIEEEMNINTFVYEDITTHEKAWAGLVKEKLGE